MTARRRKLAWIAGALVALGLLALALRADPVDVDVARAERGPLQVTVDEDGETRAHDRFVLSAPVAGRISRIELHEGDAVEPGEVVAEIWSLPLSAREHDEQLSRIRATEALVLQARERLQHAQTDAAQARRERERVEKLAESGFASQQQSEQAKVIDTTSRNELEAARFQLRAAEAEAESARAARLAMDTAPSSAGASVKVRSPAAGKVLRILEQSERVIAAGTPLLTLGDPGALEIVIDVLSNEAVKVVPDMPVMLSGWGGDRDLRARVRLVEPYAFTKISALGVEEQRVNVIADFVDSAGPLGDGYRLDARIVLWSGDDVLRVPSSALFRRGTGWSVFAVENGRARLREVELGHRGALAVEVLEGLQPGELVIRQPTNDIEDGARVRIRAEAPPV